MRKISLSSHGLSYLEGCKGFNMISFVAGGNTYNLPNFIAFFLSPKLAISFMKGGMFNTITLQTQDYAGIFQKIVDLAFGKEVEIFGTETPLKRAGQPFELAPAYLYLASDDSRYVTGQIIHVNGGTIV